ncbi:MAG: hypothetical protein IT291_04380, partial [Deltaproteobacteria bacterium]|nr:hypothetical protein [Deltaproteobacteria bacterium]
VVQWARKGISMQLEVYAETSRFGLPAGKNAITAFAALGIIMKLANKDDVKEIKNPDGSVTAEASEQLDPVTKALAVVTSESKELGRKTYKDRCDEKAPPGSRKQEDQCKYWKWSLDREKDCIKLREAWDDKWWQGRHVEHIKNQLLPRIEKLRRLLAEHCD